MKAKFFKTKIEVEPPRKTRKLTGTRFGSVLGVNPWNTPFKAWCEMTNVYHEPFEDNKYTIAGKTIEPIIIDYLKNVYGLNLASPDEIWGDEYFSKYKGDFFPENEIFGGMWDALIQDDNGVTTGVVEVKTSGRPQDWVDGVPDHYLLQVGLYADLLGVDKMLVVVGLLNEKDYILPNLFEPNAENILMFELSLSEVLPNINHLVSEAERFYRELVLEGVSPLISEDDAPLVAELKTSLENIDELGEDYQSNFDELDQILDKVERLEKELRMEKQRLKVLEKAVREHGIKKLEENPDLETIKFETKNRVWQIRKGVRRSIDKKLMKEDGILDKYEVEKVTYRMTNKSR